MSEKRSTYTRNAPEVRRRQLLDAALESFLDFGYAGASIRGIAQRAGVTEGLIYHYFPGKRALLSALLNERSPAVRIARLADEAADLNLRGGLEAVIGHLLDALEHDPRIVLFLLGQSVTDEEVANAWSEMLGGGLQAIASYLAHLQQSGEVRRGPLEPASRLLISACLMYFLVSHRLHTPSFVADRDSFVTGTAQELSAGLAPRPPRHRGAAGADGH